MMKQGGAVALLPTVVVGFVFIVLVGLSINPSQAGAAAFKIPTKPAAGGGVPCIACTLVVSIIDQLSIIHQKTVDQVVAEICDYLPAPVDTPCRQFLNSFGDVIIKLLLEGVSVDDVCKEIRFCQFKDGCRLFPPKKDPRSILPEPLPIEAFKLPRPEETPWEWLLKEINVLAQKHEPLVDFDTDLFSEYTSGLRGSNWRGKDCNDFDDGIYPGKRAPTDPRPIDYNCNGILGVDSKGNSYEDKFCKGTGARGVAILGDSAAAHFRIPETYMNASEINENTYDNIVSLLENEVDWPFLSWATGHKNSTRDCPGPVDSIYLRLWKRNHCNFRDFQNIAVNGARSGAMSSSIENSLNRNKTIDYPLLVFYALIGNDVCSPHHSLDSMTKPHEFYENIMRSLSFLDQQLPYGSHVVFVGLVDGRVLWNTLHNKTHPIGVTYARVYEFLNCLESNPCWAWLNQNETIRNAGSARAAELNQVYQQIVANMTFKNFDMTYMDFPFESVMKTWVANGGNVQDLIEPIDGFHPSQITNALLAKVIWEKLEKEHPDFLGPVNPNNAAIEAMFGNQGGY